MLGNNCAQVVVAFLLDWWWGDPRWLPHPVVAIGKSISFLENILRREKHPPLVQKLAGALLTAVVVTGTYVLAALLIRWAGQALGPGRFLLSTLLLYTTLATRSLKEHVLAVRAALKEGNLQEARQALSLVVGRDTEKLTESEIARAAIETAAENASDGIVAPLFYAFLGGAPLALAYKAVNTLDSMIGYRNQRYLYFGFAAAKLDDLANYLPARLTALLLAATGASLGLDVARALQTVRRDARKHASPNSGFPEAAMAGLLVVRLGGLNYYQGVPSFHGILGEEGQAPTPAHIDQALAVVQVAAWLALATGFFLTLISAWAVAR